MGELGLDGHSVGSGHRLALASSGRDGTGAAALGENHHEIVAHRGYLLDHHRLSALPDRHDGYNGCDTDDDTDTSQNGARFVAHDSP